MTLEERIENLERELARAKHRNRKLVLAAISLVAGILVVGAIAGAESKAQAQAEGKVSKVIRANQFMLEDEKGTVRVGLYVGKDVGKDVPTLSLSDENGKIRVQLAVHKDGPRLSLFDEKAKRRIMLDVGKDGPGMGLGDEMGMPRAILNVNKDKSLLGLFDKNGKPIWGAP